MTGIHRDLQGVTIAFDLDGTLVETAPDLIGTLNRMLGARDIPRMPVEAAQNLVGHGALALLRHGFQEAGAAWDEAAAPALLQEFLDDYLENIAVHSRPYDGVVECLERLAGRGAILCVATNKRTDLSTALIGALALERHFAVVCGPDAVSARKPDGAHIREAVQLAGGDPARRNDRSERRRPDRPGRWAYSRSSPPRRVRPRSSPPARPARRRRP